MTNGPSYVLDTRHCRLGPIPNPRQSMAIAYEKMKSGMTGGIPKVAVIPELSSADLKLARKMVLESQIPGTTITKMNTEE
ncbi:hypothetical protein SmJEL517_g04850 [Synchytrium microbalum]|uniref:Uncharacterized protein n=1 Tax=Synchytrium microbalum TaxID=1806994 RepID=A0A507BXP5_9FUNG|nr:uncharacterized protein SmJEL517_g04850 [Synchytrium microbalum]TPX31908.1 hypothetical protein SmJEL517_g04850 [Synchytrium microbalum]